MVRLGRLSSLIAAGAIAALVNTSAQGADMPRYPSAEPLPFPPREKPYVVNEYISGWYVRGDLGYRMQRARSADFDSVAIDDSKLKSVPFGGLGAGYKWQWFRADVTTDYALNSTYSGTVAGTPVSAKLGAFTVLANGYFDLGTWGGFTPYVGAGAGTSYLSLSHIMLTPAGVTVPASGQTWNFAWAAMAGVSYRLSYNWLVDVGYRHISLGDARGGDATTATQFNVRHVSGDEVRVGLRFLLD